MPSEYTALPPEFMQAHPALSLLRLAALSAGPDGMLDDDTLELMFEQVETGALTLIAPSDVWPELVRGLMANTPSNMFRALFACGALADVLPEVLAVFGVPQIADNPPEVDIGQHLLRVLDEAARCNAPLAVRFAAMAMHVGKADSPPEHLPVHYRHVERGRPRIEAMCARFGVPADCRELALLALVECERIHRVGEVRAGPVAALLVRIGAFDRPERYAQLMTLCACDYRAYDGRAAQAYPKGVLLERALKACAGIAPAAPGASAETADALQEARAAAIALAFRSERWSG
ncbi:MAG: tRNA nucleotidyltransferase [Hydrogenophilales bacterium RIFOXYD1_FULL_62_11]|nr:MAG: tRNA nucleotidyltransferase [Hydrogenophilales bacterium RIFOXYD1_FULL_62_11]